MECHTVQELIFNVAVDLLLISVTEQLPRNLFTHVSNRFLVLKTKFILTNILYSKERQAQTMASVANLDIPGELAVVYSKIDGM